MPEPITLQDERIAYTVEEWCRLTSQSRSAAYEAMKAGTLRARKCGRRTLILKSDGEAYLAGLPQYEPQAA